MFTSHALSFFPFSLVLIRHLRVRTCCTLLVPYEHSTPQSCQHYKPHYVQMARDVQATEEGKNVQFHAISCTVHKDICKQEGIRGYPSVKFYRNGNSTGFISGRGGRFFKVDEVFAELGIARRSGSESAAVKPVQKVKEPTSAEIAAKAHIRTHAELFSDAAVSFNFALHHSIYTLHGPLDTDAKNALRKWLALLHRALPPEMKATHKQIDALQKNFDEVASSEDALLKAVDGVKLDSNTWSLSCTKGDHHKGYTCGLWSMFHIISVGLVEHNTNEEEGDNMNQIATMDAANSLRDYISHFFGCEECRKNFVRSYDNCDFGRCQRLSDDPGGSADTWREFALWLFEVHNAVNVRLQREKAQREGKPRPTAEDKWQAKWPSAKACPRCWTGDDSWNKDAVYEYLRSEYWPTGGAISGGNNNKKKGGRLRKRIERIERFAMTHEAEFVDASMALASNGTVMPLAVVAVIGVFWYLLKQHRERNRYSRGKKFDGEREAMASRMLHRSPYRSRSRGKPRSAGVL